MNIDIIKKLCSTPGISGFEHPAAEYMAECMRPFCTEVRIDRCGNVIALKKSASGYGKIMIEAHIDEVGMVVTDIDSDGFLRITPVGGANPAVLYANTVRVYGKSEFVGVIGAKPPHIMTSDEYNNALDFDKLYVDVGMDKETALAMIPIGSPVTYDSDVVELKNGLISGKALDDRLSVAMLIDCAYKLANTELDYDIYFCGCVQEEVGLRGSAPVAYGINPDFAIALDVTFGVSPGSNEGSFKLGCGPVIAKGPNIHPQLVSRFISVADSFNIPYEIEVEGGSTGTDAWAIQTAREGIPTMLVSIPLRYMHTPVETVQISDCENTVYTLTEFLKSFARTEDVLC